MKLSWLYARRRESLMRKKQWRAQAKESRETRLLVYWKRSFMHSSFINAVENSFSRVKKPSHDTYSHMSNLNIRSGVCTSSSYYTIVPVSRSKMWLLFYFPLLSVHVSMSKSLTKSSANVWTYIKVHNNAMKMLHLYKQHMNIY